MLDTYNTILYGSGEDVMLQPSPEIAEQSASELELLDRDQKKYERALERIEQLYLYSEESMPEKDYVLKRNELKAMLDNIAERRAEVNSRLGLVNDIGRNIYPTFASHAYSSPAFSLESCSSILSTVSV